MSERRPHWDDSLVESVIHAISDYFDYEYRAYAVIAAVEDWHRDRWTGVCESPEEVVRELKQAQAAIQRVRELCESAITDYHRQAAKNGVARAEMARRILRALEGDNDE